MRGEGRVLICGGGVAGSVLALFLNKAGIDCCVFEAADGDQGGGGLGLAPNGMRVLRTLGVEDRVREAGIEVTTFVFWSDRGRRLCEVPMWSAERCGLSGVVVLRSTLQKLLVEEMRRAGIAYVAGRRVTEVEDAEGRRVVVRFGDGGQDEGGLLVGADGIRSTVRRLVMPDSPKPVYTGLAGLGGFSPRLGSGRSGAQGGTKMHMVMGRNGFFGYTDVPTPEGVQSMWWNTAEEPLPDRQAERLRSHEDRIARSLERHAGWAEPVPTLLRETTDLLSTSIHDVPELPRWSVGRTVLIGDAAHAVAPHSGQGASMAMEDAMMLAKLLRDRDWHDGGAVLREFEAARRPRTTRVIALGRKNGDRKKEIPTAAYWVLQQAVRWVMPSMLRRQDWLLRYAISW